MTLTTFVYRLDSTRICNIYKRSLAISGGGGKDQFGMRYKTEEGGIVFLQNENEN